MPQPSATGRKPTVAEALQEIMEKPVVGQDVVNVVFDLGRGQGYRVAKNGPFPVVRFNDKTIRYPTPPLREALRVNEPTAA
ncbi:hypothetical protein [Methylobacterium sp. E-046]|uniref:hypothetical protein n=1 Tax=Methylobacterium sp. E-046 TaxID=2836576 RepID=UPI001FBB15D5|nr:hypothetical protein [Methylobacterium sp. E-046]MCJ2098449.1 hypothetical protein [Methylobacterium sp. E-046]